MLKTNLHLALPFIAPDRDGPTGRIKFGTESKGGFKNITVSNCVFDRSRGLAIESVEDTKVGAIRRVTISGVVASNCDARYPILIAGLTDHPVVDVRISAVRVVSRGGLSMEQVAQQPADLVNTFFLRGAGLAGPRDPFAPPEQKKTYPEPSMFGLLPAYGVSARHAAFAGGLRASRSHPS